MLKPKAWSDLLHLEPDFLELEEQARAGALISYRQLPPEVFACHAWDLIPEQRLFDLILPFLRQQVARAQTGMPAIYAQRLKEIHAGEIRSLEDWRRVPLLLKDDDPDHGLPGFRLEANRDPRVMRPLDLGEGNDRPALVAFGSGGSLGVHTPTFVSLQDRAREIQGWRRGHAYHGLAAGDRVLYTYNPTHKGGQWMQESLWAHGVDVVLRRPEDDAQRVLDNLRTFNVNALFTVQQPYESLHQQAKAAGINLHALIMASLENPSYRGLLLPDEAGRQQVEFIFLGGFEIVPYAQQLAHEYLADIPIATLLGSSEAIPQACSTNPRLTPAAACHLNNLHLLQAPHYVEVVKPGPGGAWVPAKKGEQGLLVYTSWARDGTIWIRYAPGDVATRLLDEGECTCGLYSPVITDVHRQDPREMRLLLDEGCAAG